MDRPLRPGLYRTPITRSIDADVEALGTLAELAPLDTDSPTVLARYVSGELIRVLRSAADAQDQVEIVNKLLDVLHSANAITRTEELLAVLAQRDGFGAPIRLPRPATAIDQNALLVNAPLEPNLGSELRQEIGSADRIDLLCAFIVWSGLNAIHDDLEAAAKRGVPLRVITTTYTGVSDPRAVDELRRIGAEIKVSYDVRGTRLHAKAWLFHRDSGFSTAYVGSSNLSHSAIHFGLEWNVRLAEASSPELVSRFRAAFDGYWADPSFEPYEKGKFADLIIQEKSAKPLTTTLFDIRPYPYQQEMLDRLDVERKRFGRFRNLLVAATGTGKTVVSAFDYKRLRQEWNGQGQLLFVAHRQEILEQSRDVFRNVLHDGSFGELMVGGQRPTSGQHVFA